MPTIDPETLEAARERLGKPDYTPEQVLAEIRTSHKKPPVPSRAFDYAAWFDCHEEWHTGYGATRDAAIADLLEWL
jgi:hypothetical protein